VRGRRYPPKQVIACATGLDRADLTTHQARRILVRLGFMAARLASRTGADVELDPELRNRGRQAAALAPYAGHWVALEPRPTCSSPPIRLRRYSRGWRITVDARTTGCSGFRAPPARSRAPLRCEVRLRTTNRFGSSLAEAVGIDRLERGGRGELRRCRRSFSRTQARADVTIAGTRYDAPDHLLRTMAVLRATCSARRASCASSCEPGDPRRRLVYRLRGANSS
jgi:hypothetical protein